MYKIGLDVGSTTAKIAVLDADNKLIYSRYERHQAQVSRLVGRYFDELSSKIGDAECTICVTGSVGMATAEQLKAEFVQEVVAATIYAKKQHPEAKAIIDIGGEDAKVVLLNGRNTELRMNGNCAGGTGAFLDQMAVLMGVDNRRMSELAMQATEIYPMAARCGVFAKTDIQNLMSRNLPETNIAASIFHSVAVQTVVTLAHGCQFEAPILLCGGPLTFLPALRKAFADYLKMKPEDFIVSSNSNLIPAMGCALHSIQNSKLPYASHGDLRFKIQNSSETPNSSLLTPNSSLLTPNSPSVSLNTLRKRISEKRIVKYQSDMEPLFRSDREHYDWLAEKNQYETNVVPMRRGEEQVVIGIDSGSTTTKLVAMRPTGEIIFTDYSLNQGNPVNAVKEALGRMDTKAKENGSDLKIIGSCSTGYGEELIRKAFNLDSGIIETMAHYRAAAQLMPDVSFILDIGGQDMKAIFVEDGAVVRMELNEACSSGCGTFIQTFANSLGYKVEEFAQLACTAQQPCDLGTRCTVFMNSKVKQVLREGATISDISAGISYSVIRNCLYKVLKLRGNDSLGNHIVLQGGTMRNDSVVRAFELLTHTKVARSNMPELMGAIGCALHAIQNSKLPYASHSDLRFKIQNSRTVSDLLSLASYDTRQLQCKGCENHCRVTSYKFAGGNRFYSGNKCERVFNNQGHGAVHGLNIYPYKYHLLFDRQSLTEGRRIGIPRILNQYEDYPFWHALLTEAGFQVVLSSESVFSRYEKALGSVMSDNICFPAKLVHSHIAELDHAGVERILMPYVVYEHKDDERTLNSYNCPVVSGYADVIKSAMSPKTPVDAPVINFADEKLLHKQIIEYLHTLGISKAVARRAFAKAVEAQRQYAHAIKAKNEEILAESRKAGRLTILLAGRPYHTDPLIQHKLSDMVANLGADVISDDIVRGNNTIGSGEIYLVKQWAYMNRIIKSAQWAAEQDDHLHFVEMTSFGCGPDAFIQDEVGDILRRHGKPFTLLKIDDVSNIGSLKLRVRSLVESLKFHVVKHETKPFVTTRVFHKKDAHRKILAPYFTEYLTPVMTPLLRLMGYDVEVLPMSDADSAEVGLKYANNEVCYPATLIVGNIIKALRSGPYDLKNTAVAMSETGGQCRATNYAGLIKRAMVANGFEDVPLITLGVSSADIDGTNEQDGFEIQWFRYRKIIVVSILFGDAISEMYNATVVRERHAGHARELKDKYLIGAEPFILNNDHEGLLGWLAQAATEFDDEATNKPTAKVGIVGEIFLKFNPFAHQFIERYVISKGIEVVPPLLAPFFLQDFVNEEVKKNMHLSCSRVPNIVLRAAYQLLIGNIMERINKISSRFRYFRPFTNIYDDARHVDGIVSMAAQFGEGWLLPSDIVGYMHDGVENVISLQPFGCIANHIISKGIEKRLHKLFPELNMVSLDFDSGVSEVNVTNRLLLFLDNIAV